MSLVPLSEILSRIHSRIKDAYLPGYYRYLDEKYDNAFSKAADSFEEALIKNKDNNAAQALAGIEYEKIMMSKIDEYEKHLAATNSKAFLDGMQEDLE